MNRLNGTITQIKSVDGISQISVAVVEKVFNVLVLSHEDGYQQEQNVTLLFKETEVMIATVNSVVSARNSFVSPIKDVIIGKILAEVQFDFDGVTITAIITRGALDSLGCHVGDLFQWFVKSNEVTLQNE